MILCRRVLILSAFLFSASAKANLVENFATLFATPLASNIYDFHLSNLERGFDREQFFHAHAPIWLIKLRDYSPKARINQEMAERLADLAYEWGQERNTRGWCLGGVAHILNKLMEGRNNFYRLPIDDTGTGVRVATQNAASSAAAFGAWVKANPISVCERFGFLPVDEMHHGYIAIYDPGQCGFHSRFGHIEIIVEELAGCSDHCRPLKLDCSPSTVLAPVEDCSNFVSSRALSSSELNGAGHPANGLEHTGLKTGIDGDDSRNSDSPGIDTPASSDSLNRPVSDPLQRTVRHT